MTKGWFVRTILVSLLLPLVLLSATGNSADDAKTVAALDTEYQAAVKIDNAATTSSS